MLSCEICSAAYVFDMTVRTGVVNSLFGDGAAAILVLADDSLSHLDGPQLMDFESILVHEGVDEMRFDFVDGKFNFYLGRDIPYVIGENVKIPVGALLKRHGLKKRDIQHWLIHSGGKKVIDAIKYNLGLTEHDVRHTRSILRQFGNLSSGAFLFSFQELTREQVVREGDWGVTIAMGPGLSIETGLIRW
jgi:predicted naringenin-chalcone synthase